MFNRPKKIYVGEYGFPFVWTALESSSGAGPDFVDDFSPIDISGFTSMRIDFTDPSGSETPYTHLTVAPGELVTDGTDGKFQFKTWDGQLITAGTWKVQASVTTADRTWWSEIYKFDVLARLDT